MATETLDQLRERIANEPHTFWYSEQHAQWYKHINEMNLTDYDGRPDPILKNLAEIDGEKIPYTACTTEPGVTEPFEGALKTFPDYKQVAEGKISNIRTRGTW